MKNSKVIVTRAQMDEIIDRAPCSIDDLKELFEIIDTAVEVRYSVEFESYNSRRFSKPWIAKVTAWSVGDHPELEWGGYCGDDNGGEAEITATPGDIIRYGQRDNRGNRTVNKWAIAQADGTLLEVTQVEARKAFKSH